MNSTLTEITVVGDDDTGLLAQITTLLFEHDINIEDLNQAVEDDLFRMTMQVDISEMDCSRDKLQKELTELCEDLGVDVRIRYPNNGEEQTIAVLVTKESHCLKKLLKEVQNDDFGAEIGVVIGNHSELRPLAEQYGVPFHDIGDENGSPDEDRLLELLGEYNTDLVALARYIRILSPKVVFRYQNRIINVHPSLLPAFPGASAYMQAIEEGARIAGVTAHYVTPDLDQGPIITQRAFNVPDKTSEEEMKQLGQPLEAEVLIEGVRLHIENDLLVGRGRTHVRDNSAQLGLPSEIQKANPSEPVDREPVEASTQK